MIHFRVNLAREEKKKKKEKRKKAKTFRGRTLRIQMRVPWCTHALWTHYKTPLKSGTVVNT
jgi:hypothetical protein